MYAIRCRRIASGTTVDGVRYEHSAWTAVEEVPAAAQEATVAPGNGHALLEIVEFNEVGDASLQGLPIVGAAETDAAVDAAGAGDPYIEKLLAAGKRLGLDLSGRSAEEMLVAIIERVPADDNVYAPGHGSDGTYLGFAKDDLELCAGAVGLTVVFTSAEACVTGILGAILDHARKELEAAQANPNSTNAAPEDMPWHIATGTQSARRVVDGVETICELDALKQADLIEIATGLSVETKGNMSKASIIRAIREKLAESTS